MSILEEWVSLSYVWLLFCVILPIGELVSIIFQIKISYHIYWALMANEKYRANFYKRRCIFYYILIGLLFVSGIIFWTSFVIPCILFVVNSIIIVLISLFTWGRYRAFMKQKYMLIFLILTLFFCLLPMLTGLFFI